MGLGPKLFEKFVLGNEATWIFDQITEYVIGFRRNSDALLPTPKALVCRIKAERPKGFH